MGLRKLFRARQRAAAPKQEVLPISLQLLFPGPQWIAAGWLAHTLKELYPSLAQVRVETQTGDLGAGMGQLARVKWGRHTVHVGVFGAPMARSLLEQSLKFAFYGDELKQQAEAHAAHMVILYKGEEPDPLEQYVALGLVAMALAPLGASLVLNTSAYTSYPARLLVPHPGEDADTVLRALPLPALFVGFVRMLVDGFEGVWMRTCGAPLMDLPDLAWHARSHEESQEMFFMFDGIFNAMRTSNVRFKPGDTVLDGHLRWRFRKPRGNEGFLHSPRMVVLERDHEAERLI